MATNDILKKLGLEDKEIKVYLILLKSGKLRPSAISRLTKINRATVYNVAKSLLSKGLIAEDLGGNTLFLSPLPLESLQQLTEKPRRELDKKDALIKRAIASLSLLTAHQRYSVPKIRFVEEQDLEDFLYENAVKWIDELPKKDGIWWSFQDHSFVENYQKFVEWVGTLPQYKKPGIKSHLLTNKSTIEDVIKEKISRSKRDIRFLKDVNFTSSIWVSGDYIVMVVTREHPFYLVEIHDAMLAHNLREILKKLWESCESPDR